MIPPRFTPIFQGILRCILAILLGSFLFCLHIFIGNIFKGFCFYHVNTFRCFDYEIRFIAFGSIGPIYVELVRCRSQPPQYIIIRLQHIRKIELGFAVELTLRIIYFKKPVNMNLRTKLGFTESLKSIRPNPSNSVKC